MSDSHFLYHALTDSRSITCMVILAVLVPLALLMVRLLIVMGRPRRAEVEVDENHEPAPRRSLLRDEDGTATMEFALVLPILLFVILTLAQTTLLQGGVIFVNYAAEAAVRSAVVQIPYDYPGEPANTYDGSPGTPKYDAIQRSAAMALMPIASGPASGNGSANTAGFVDGLNQFYSAYGDTPPPWIAKFAAQRLSYALSSTEVHLYRLDVPDDVTVTPVSIDGSTVDPKDPIRVQVVHQLNLSIPYANRIFADGVQSDGISRYTTVTASETLPNEGFLDTMPPPPSVPRLP